MKYFERNKEYKFELAEGIGRKVTFIPKDFDCQSHLINIQHSFITIRKRYAWDGSSIPLKKFMRAITFKKYDPDKYCKIASLMHDAFYQLMRLGKLSRDHKDAIDRLYEKMCIQGGMSKRAASRRYWAVSKFGGRTLNPRYCPEKEILET